VRSATGFEVGTKRVPSTSVRNLSIVVIFPRGHGRPPEHLRVELALAGSQEGGLELGSTVSVRVVPDRRLVSDQG